MTKQATKLVLQKDVLMLLVEASSAQRQQPALRSNVAPGYDTY
jgi:hypothetical protein